MDISPIGSTPAFVRSLFVGHAWRESHVENNDVDASCILYFLFALSDTSRDTTVWTQCIVQTNGQLALALSLFCFYQSDFQPLRTEPSI